MTSDDDPPISRDAYDEMAGDYEVITGSPNREHYEWPAVQSLLPDLDGVHLLDAACGDGFYTERFVEAGATAVGVDASPEMVARARERFRDDDRVTVRRADLTGGLTFLDDAAFDLVVSQLTLDHVEDWASVFEAFHRVLAPGGRAVVSTSHPVRDYVDAEYAEREHVRADGASYPDVERVDHNWGGEDEEFLVPFYRRPLEAVFGPPTDAGLLVERVVEPELTDAYAETAPESAREFRHDPPNFICLRCAKPGVPNGE